MHFAGHSNRNLAAQLWLDSLHKSPFYQVVVVEGLYHIYNAHKARHRGNPEKGLEITIQVGRTLLKSAAKHSLFNQVE